MKAVEIITDGSYLREKIGVGYVRVKSELEDGSIDFCANSDSIKLPGKSYYGSQAAEAAAVVFALDELSDDGYTGDVVIYCDLADLIKYINGIKNRIDPTIQYIYDELDNCIARHSSVRSMHPKQAKHLPDFFHSIAHNASAMESGANKREITTPDYNGRYASKVDTKRPYRSLSRK